MIETTSNTLLALRQLVDNDPVLQRQLFGIPDPADFIAAVNQLAQSSGHKLTDDEVLQAMRCGRKLWLDRTLP